MCADPSPFLPRDMLACSAAWASRAASSRLPHLALFSHFRVIALLRVQCCCSHLLPPMLHPSGNATRAAPCPARGGVTPALPAHVPWPHCVQAELAQHPHMPRMVAVSSGGLCRIFLSDTTLELHTVPMSLYGCLCCSSSHFLSWQGLGLRGVDGPAYSV